MPSFELAKGYTKPVDKKPDELPNDIIQAYNNIQSRRKLALILRSKAVKEIPLSIGDSIEVYRKIDKQKRGSWIPKTIMKLDHQSRTIVVPGKKGKTITVSIEDVRLPIEDHEFSRIVSDGLDKMDGDIEEIMDNIQFSKCEVESGHLDKQVTPESSHTNEQYMCEENQNEYDGDFSMIGQTSTPIVGDEILVYWPDDDTYYPGTVHSIDDDQHTIHYDDGDIEKLSMENEIWMYQNHESNAAGNGSAAVTGNSSSLQVVSTEDEVLQELVAFFGNKAFLKHQSQGFQQFPMLNAYEKEEEQFLKTVDVIPIQDFKKKLTIINSHVIYKVKKDDEEKLKLKSQNSTSW